MAPRGKSHLLLDSPPQNCRYIDAPGSFPQAENLDFSLDMAKRERVTLEQLARYDDILTDVLVDHVSAHLFNRLFFKLLTINLGVFLDYN